MAAVLRAATHDIAVRWRGQVGYESAWRAMRDFTATRTATTPDELWLLEHPPVYTTGYRGRARAPTTIHGIPVVASDRGGDMTYHGPGQLVVYLLLDLAHRGLGVTPLVQRLEQAVIQLLADDGIAAHRRPGAPGVYVENKKIAALGLRVRNGCCYHGLALNVNMDLTPFAHIDPCGIPGLDVTQLSGLGIADDMVAVRRRLLDRLLPLLGYTHCHVLETPNP